jgi:predicted metalloprotease
MFENVTKFDITHALLSLRPGAIWSIHDEDYSTLDWQDTVQTKPTVEELNTEVARLQAEYDAKQYQRDRKEAYKSIEEQLDMLYWDKVNGTNLWKEHIDSVKDDNPKPTE